MGSLYMCYVGACAHLCHDHSIPYIIFGWSLRSLNLQRFSTVCLMFVFHNALGYGIVSGPWRSVPYWVTALESHVNLDLDFSI